MKTFIILLLPIALPLLSQATPTLPALDVNLRQVANEQLATPAPSGKLNEQSSWTETRILLKDEFNAPARRNYDLTARVLLEPYRPQGTITLDNIGTYSLNQVGQTILPSVQMGFVRELSSDIKWGANVRAALTSQQMEIAQNNGNLTATKLTSSMIAIGPEVRFATSSSQWLSILAAEIGTIQLIQTSPYSQYRWSQSATFTALNLGFMRTFGESYAAEILYTTRQIVNAGGELQLGRDTLTAGAEYRW